jgi:hypothetical protein
VRAQAVDFVFHRGKAANAAAPSLRRWSRPEHNWPLGTAVVQSGETGGHRPKPWPPELQIDQPLGEEFVDRILVLGHQPGLGELAVAMWITSTFLFS